MRSLCKYWCWIGRSLQVLKLIIQNAQESYHVVLGVRGAGGCLGEGHPLLGVAEHQWLGQGGGLGGLHGGIFRLWGGGWGSLPQQHRKVNPLARWKYDKLTFKNYNKKNPYNFKATPRYGLLFFLLSKVGENGHILHAQQLSTIIIYVRHTGIILVLGAFSGHVYSLNQGFYSCLWHMASCLFYDMQSTPCNVNKLANSLQS